MAYTTAQRDALKAALATGALSVSEGDKRVEYRSRAEMLDQLAAMNAELGDATESAPRMSVMNVRMD